jgi:hypothetical protein
MTSFRCECGDEGCTGAIRLTLAEYESVREHATHFVIAHNHENPESEGLVADDDRFAVVAVLTADAVRLARTSYPRQWHPANGSVHTARSGGTGR